MCPNGYDRIANYCYLMHEPLANFTDQTEVCENKGGYLAKIDDDQEFAVYTTYLEGNWLSNFTTECFHFILYAQFLDYKLDEILQLLVLAHNDLD